MSENEDEKPPSGLESDLGTDEVLARWRLVLGKYAQRQLGNPTSLDQQRMERALEKLYGREYAGRGVRQGRPDSSSSAGSPGPGSLEPSQLSVPQWLGEVRDLFSNDTCKKITQHALDRYGMTEIVSDPKTLRDLQPSSELLASVLMLKGIMNPAVLAEVRRLVRRVVRDIQDRIRLSVQQRITGKRNRFKNSNVQTSANFDARKTIHRNLKHFDPSSGKIVVQRPFFNSRARQHLPWEIILCVDQSGSMAQSLIHSAVLAGAISELPAIKVRLVVFDTSVVDLTEHVSDPVEVLMSVQLGGGTNIGKAMQYCRTLVTNPGRTVLVLVTDFCEGADPRVLRSTVRSMRSDGCKLIGLASLEEQGHLWFDEQMAQRLTADGMEIAAVTPNRLADWLAQVMSE